MTVQRCNTLAVYTKYPDPTNNALQLPISRNGRVRVHCWACARSFSTSPSSPEQCSCPISLCHASRKTRKTRTLETTVPWAWAVRPDQAKHWPLLETPARRIINYLHGPPCIIHAPRSTRQPRTHQWPAAGTARLLIEVGSRSFASYNRCQAHSPRAASCKHVSASLSTA
jgi:hypothetical protein